MAKLWFPEEGMLRKTILPDLDKGRKNWDRPHAEAVVYWMKQLLKELDLDKKVMITAAYAHDWGYVGMFPDRTSYESVQAAKKNHMKVGARKIFNFLTEKFGEIFRVAQIERISHLVRVHDMLDEINEGDEVVLMEADTLGALDADRVKPTYSKEDNDKFLKETNRKRRPLFIHKTAIEAYSQLLKKRKKYYEKHV